MKKLRAAVCVLLVLCMLFAFAACGKKEDVKAPSDDGADANSPVSPDTPDTSNTPAADDKEGSGTNVTSFDRADLIFISEEEYNNRPDGLQPGTVINYVAQTDVPSYLPWNCTSEGWVHQNLYENLLYMHRGDVNDIRGCVASEWGHSDDYLTWTFKIKEGINFTDGTVCDAHAIEEAWNFYAEASPATVTNYNVDSWEATGDYEFKVYLTAPCPYFEVAMSSNNFMILSPTALSAYGINDNRAAISTGPYYVESYTPGVGFVWKANTEYKHVEERIPHLETINLQIINDQTTRFMALLNGDVDGLVTNKVEIYYNLIDNGFDGTIITTLGDVDPFWFNAKQIEEFRIKEVRMAICRFIDWTAIDELVFDGFADTPDSLWARNTSGYVPTDKFYYDPEEGHELLSSAGIDPSDLIFEGNILDSSADLFVALQDALAQQGVTMDIIPIESEANFTYLMNGDWTVTTGCNGYRNTKPYNPWTFILPEGCLIKHIWCDYYDMDLYNTLQDEYVKMCTAATWDEMLEHCHNLTTLVQDDFGGIAAIQHPSFVILSKKFKNGVYFDEPHAPQFYYMYV